MKPRLALAAEMRPALDENGVTTHIHAQTPGLGLGKGDACEAWDPLYDEDSDDLAASIGVLVTDCQAVHGAAAWCCSTGHHVCVEAAGHLESVLAGRAHIYCEQVVDCLSPKRLAFEFEHDCGGVLEPACGGGHGCLFAQGNWAALALAGDAEVGTRAFECGFGSVQGNRRVHA